MAMGVLKRSAGRGRRAPMAEINVTPFVDVMLVLLIIFMVTAPMLNAGVPVELPESRANALPQEQQELVVTVAGDGTIYLDDSALAPGELGDRLANVIPDDAGQLPSVTLRAEKTLDYGRVMAVMGELNRAGFTSISLVTGGSDESP